MTHCSTKKKKKLKYNIKKKQGEKRKNEGHFDFASHLTLTSFCGT